MTAEGKITAARLELGARILVHRNTEGALRPSLRKTEQITATVTALAPVKRGRIIETDAGVLQVPAHQTFWRAQ